MKRITLLIIILFVISMLAIAQLCYQSCYWQRKYYQLSDDATRLSKATLLLLERYKELEAELKKYKGEIPKPPEVIEVQKVLEWQ